MTKHLLFLILLLSSNLVYSQNNKFEIGANIGICKSWFTIKADKNYNAFTFKKTSLRENYGLILQYKLSKKIKLISGVDADNSSFGIASNQPKIITNLSSSFIDVSFEIRTINFPIAAGFNCYFKRKNPLLSICIGLNYEIKKITGVTENYSIKINETTGDTYGLGYFVSNDFPTQNGIAATIGIISGKVKISKRCSLYLMTNFSTRFYFLPERHVSVTFANITQSNFEFYETSVKSKSNNINASLLLSYSIF